MAFEHYFSNGWMRHIPAPMSNSEKFKPCFDCNICLDFASEPVVTLCGHLYCWPCIYKWLLHVQTTSFDLDEPPQCPVCKADISHTTMIPLYGRGQSAKEAEVDAKELLIPPRPSAFGNKALATIRSNHVSGQQLPYEDLYQNQNYDFDMYDSYDEDSSSSLYNLEHTSVDSFRHPATGMFGGTVYARLFGNSDNLYAHPNSYALTGSSSPRLRRQEMLAEKSLNRLSIFLFCCFVLFLVFF